MSKKIIMEKREYDELDSLRKDFDKELDKSRKKARDRIEIEYEERNLFWTIGWAMIAIIELLIILLNKFLW